MLSSESEGEREMNAPANQQNPEAQQQADQADKEKINNDTPRQSARRGERLCK